MPFILTRLQVGNYDSWKAQFDQDAPGARREAKRYRIFRNTDDPGEVFIQVVRLARRGRRGTGAAAGVWRARPLL
jgi:hypothetical protein